MQITAVYSFPDSSFPDSLYDTIQPFQSDPWRSAGSFLPRFIFSYVKDKTNPIPCKGKWIQQLFLYCKLSLRFGTLTYASFHYFKGQKGEKGTPCDCGLPVRQPNAMARWIDFFAAFFTIAVNNWPWTFQVMSQKYAINISYKVHVLLTSF